LSQLTQMDASSTERARRRGGVDESRFAARAGTLSGGESRAHWGARLGAARLGEWSWAPRPPPPVATVSARNGWAQCLGRRSRPC
jgi:hypothetical protein